MFFHLCFLFVFSAGCVFLLFFLFFVLICVDGCGINPKKNRSLLSEICEYTNFWHKISGFFVRNILELKKYWSHKTLFFEFKPQTCTPKHQKQSLRIQLQINTQQLILIQVGKTQVCIVYTLKYSILQSNKTQNMLLFCTNFKRKYHIHS